MTTLQRQLCNPSLRELPGKARHAQHLCSQLIFGTGPMHVLVWRFVCSKHLHTVGFPQCWMLQIRHNKPSMSPFITPALSCWAVFPPGTNPSPSSRFPVLPPKPK